MMSMASYWQTWHSNVRFSKPGPAAHVGWMISGEFAFPPQASRRHWRVKLAHGCITPLAVPANHAYVKAITGSGSIASGRLLDALPNVARPARNR
jgi:hypothetical protein